MRDWNARNQELDQKIRRLQEEAGRLKAQTFEPITYPANSPQYRATYYYRRQRYILAKAALKYQLKNKQKLLASWETKQARQRKQAETREQRLQERIEYLKLSSIRKMLGMARRRARQVNVPFNLEVADIVIPETCPILGLPLIRSKGQGPTKNSPSIDRIIPQNGYIKGNVQIISRQANTMKNDATPEQLQRFAQWIIETFPR